MPTDDERSDLQVSTEEALVPSPLSPELGQLLMSAEKLAPEQRLRLISGLWASLPSWHCASPRPGELAQLRQLLDEYDSGGSPHFPWAAVQTLIVDSGPVKAPKVYSVPRRFDLSTIFVVTLAYSLLLGTMKALGVPPVASLVVTGFISIIAAGQALFFGGNQPRKASVLTGTVVYSIAMFSLWLYNGPRMYPTMVIAIMASYTLIGGAILGYLSGVVVGGIFLIADKVRNRFGRKMGVSELPPNRP
jgi:hypothetical protein